MALPCLSRRAYAGHARKEPFINGVEKIDRLAGWRMKTPSAVKSSRALKPGRVSGVSNTRRSAILGPL
jgi:hypothetical protein